VPGGLLTDLYELNMAASYLRRSMTGAATFSLFVRALPPGRGFLVAAGLADCLRFLADFSFTRTIWATCARPRGTGRTPCARSRDCGSPARCGRCPKGRSSSPASPCWR
jgi:Nicotinate phosphoribosyltransferase (NAPRTase) N-terminal domain